jgi:hypothetical protein
MVRFEDSNKVYEKQVDASFLEDYLIDPELLSWSPGPKALEVTKIAIEILDIAKNKPARLINIFEDKLLEKLINSKGSQIGNKDTYLSHIVHTSMIFGKMVETLLKLHPRIDLPPTLVAGGLGLIHDLNATYSDYQKTGQQSKEIDLYFHARHLGIPLISHHVAMHSGYLEIARLIHDKELAGNVAFPKSSVYQTMQNIFWHEGPFSIESIHSEFCEFMAGRDNLPLICLSVADYLENGKSEFNQGTIEEDFRERSFDIASRYAYRPMHEKKQVSALGIALTRYGAMDRLISYKNIVKDLLENKPDVIEKYKERTTFWKG